MKRSRGIRPEWDRDEGGIAKKSLRFLARHGEKFVAGGILIAAVWIALQVRNHQSLSWQAGELEQLAAGIEETITKIDPILEERELRSFNYSAYAEQIRETIPSVPYRSDIEWFPSILPAPLPRGGFEILTAKSFRAEAARRTGLTAQGSTAEQFSGTVGDKRNPAQSLSAIWVNLYGTITVWEQWGIYNQALYGIDTNRPEYVSYELEKVELRQKKIPEWTPIKIAAAGEPPTEHRILFGQRQESLQEPNLLLYSDFDVEPGKTYVYRIRLYLRNPNYNLQETSVEEGVDTHNELVRSEWSVFARVYVPDRTLVLLRSVTPSDLADFPRQADPLRPVSGTLILDYFDTEQGLSLPVVEKTAVLRGALGNMSKEDASRYVNRGGAEVIVNYPDTGLRSNVCLIDFSGGRKLQKRLTRALDLFVPGSALLLMPDGTMQTLSTEPELFR